MIKEPTLSDGKPGDVGRAESITDWEKRHFHTFTILAIHLWRFSLIFYFILRDRVKEARRRQQKQSAALGAQSAC